MTTFERSGALKVEPQLDGSASEAYDCGPAAVAVALDDLSYGLIRPTTEQVRKRMGGDKDTTNPDQWKQAIDSYADRFRKLGLHPPRTSVVRGRSLDDVWPLLKGRNRRILGAIHYGTVAKRKRRLWSSRSFRGNHAVYFRGGKVKDEGRRVPTYDSLADGRIAGIPRGRKLWPLWLVKAALGNVRDSQGGRIYPKADRWIGLVVSKAKPITEPDEGIDPGDPTGPPDPPDVLEMLDAISDAYDDFEDVVEASTAGMADLEPFLPTESESDSEPQEGIEP